MLCSYYHEIFLNVFKFMFYKWNLMAQWSMPRGLEPPFTCGSGSCHCPLVTPGPLGLAKPCIHCIAPGQWPGGLGWGPYSTITFHLGRNLSMGAGAVRVEHMSHSTMGWQEGRCSCPSLTVHDMFHVPLIRGLLSPSPRNQEYPRMEVAILWGLFICQGLKWWTNGETNFLVPTLRP